VFQCRYGRNSQRLEALQYFSCPNQFLAKLDSDKRDGTRRLLMAFSRTRKEGACCGGNVHRIFSNYVIRMWMRHDGTRRGSLRPFESNNHRGTRITANRNYADHSVSVRGTNSLQDRVPDRPVTFLYPCAYRRGARHRVSPSMALPLRLLGSQRLFDLDRKFAQATGDLDSSDANRHHALAAERNGIERRPIGVFVPIKEKWTPHVEPKYTTEDFPSWEATPESAWNYGIAVDPALCRERSN